MPLSLPSGDSLRQDVVNATSRAHGRIAIAQVVLGLVLVVWGGYLGSLRYHSMLYMHSWLPAIFVVTGILGFQSARIGTCTKTQLAISHVVLLVCSTTTSIVLMVTSFEHDDYTKFTPSAVLSTTQLVLSLIAIVLYVGKCCRPLCRRNSAMSEVGLQQHGLGARNVSFCTQGCCYSVQYVVDHGTQSQMMSTAKPVKYMALPTGHEDEDFARNY